MTPVDGWPHDPTAAPALSATHNPDGTLKTVEAALDESGTRLLGHVRGLLHTFSTLHLGKSDEQIEAEAQTNITEGNAEPVNDEPGPGFDALRARRAERTTDVSDPTL